jgi:hypothetical protein
MGMFYRTLRIIDNGIKPCYVFDGAPPTLKNGEVRLPLLNSVLSVCVDCSWRNGLRNGRKRKRLRRRQRKLARQRKSINFRGGQFESQGNITRNVRNFYDLWECRTSMPPVKQKLNVLHLPRQEKYAPHLLPITWFHQSGSRR